MPHGVIEGFSEVVQWKIPDFFSLDRIKNEYIESPQFSLMGCTWRLRVFLKGSNSVYGWMSAFLRLEDSTTKPVTYIIGLKRSDGKIEEVRTDFNRKFGINPCFGWKQFFDLKNLQERKSELAPSDTVTVTCRIERETPTPETIDAQNHQEVDSPPTTFVELEDLSSDFQALLNKEKTCDFTVSVQGKEFRVHRSVLAARSPVFSAMFEHDTAEAKSGVLNIPDCHSESFQQFISFLYTGKIEEVTFETAYQLYSIAEKYDVKLLKSLCCNYLGQNLSTETIWKVVILSDQFSDDQLLSSAQEFFNKNFMQIFLTSEWEAMLKNNYRLANKICKGMASASLKNS